jgi:hypothetical protein
MEVEGEEDGEEEDDWNWLIIINNPFGSFLFNLNINFINFHNFKILISILIINYAKYISVWTFIRFINL